MAKKAKSVKRTNPRTEVVGVQQKNFVAILMLQNIRVWYWDLCS